MMLMVLVNYGSVFYTIMCLFSEFSVLGVGGGGAGRTLGAREDSHDLVSSAQAFALPCP